mmetsp:Transcript_32753/g.92912  ORF Transcript_32753/g.92912 Transcript_32753/m.92912 type:complete len:332 (-) Transcript_32753:1033-2028(-)
MSLTRGRPSAEMGLLEYCVGLWIYGQGVGGEGRERGKRGERILFGHHGLNLLQGAALGLGNDLGSKQDSEQAGGCKKVVYAAHANGVYKGEEELPNHEVARPVGGHGKRHRKATNAFGGNLRDKQRGDGAAANGKAQNVRQGAEENQRGSHSLECRQGEGKAHDQHTYALASEAAVEQRLAAQLLNHARSGNGAQDVDQPCHRIGEGHGLDASLLEDGAREEEHRVDSAELLEEEDHEGNEGDLGVLALEQLAHRDRLLRLVALGGGEGVLEVVRRSGPPQPGASLLGLLNLPFGREVAGGLRAYKQHAEDEHERGDSGQGHHGAPRLHRQ